MTAIAEPIFTELLRTHLQLRRRGFYPLLGCTGLAFAFLLMRFHLAGNTGYRFLVWNLFLAWLPWWCAILTDGVRRTRPQQRKLIAACALAWLITFPNAFYIFTDLVHLFGRPVLTWWYDMGLILTFALAGCFLAITSLQIMHDLVRDVAGAILGWLFVFASTALCGFGVYLGRFERLNSWDILRPQRLVPTILSTLDDRSTCGVTLMFGGMLLACYLMFHHSPRRSL